MARFSVHVPGMACRHCVRTISAAVSDLAGVHSVVVDLVTRTVTVQGLVDVDEVREAVAIAGYAVAEDPPRPSVPPNTV